MLTSVIVGESISGCIIKNILYSSGTEKPVCFTEYWDVLI